MEEYMARIDKEIKEGEERCKRPGEGRLGESTDYSLREIITVNDELQNKEDVEMESENVEGKHKDLSPMLRGTEQAENKKTFGKENIYSLLKETMAGSMREVIKDELQAWLGLRYHGTEEDAEMKEGTDSTRRSPEEKEEGELDGALNVDDDTPNKGGRMKTKE